MTRGEILATAIAVLLTVWLGGILASRTVGGALHLLPVICAGLAVVGLIRRPKSDDPV